MNKKNIEIINVEVWKKFEHEGQYYYIEVFYYIDGTVQAFANKKPDKVQHISEEFPIGIGRDEHDSTKAAIQAIYNIANQ
ncbi:hypothetical protein [Neobacillus sp. CF12]|uniref:hypothetical protein n=1 Tax=Neobacillus sp. CF12 TaxID=3055864 RepID=UPI0025A02A8E|nr:hypothetical protein [Neobacillus sp. CF12]MDM5329855.1 hypothetical protein [Neobacillus sp. CF12]